MEKAIDWNALRDQAYEMACRHGFHDKKRSVETAVELIHCELAEATESLRKGEPKHWLAEGGKPEGFCVELVDAIIRILDFMGETGMQETQPQYDPFVTVLSPMELMKVVRMYLCKVCIWFDAYKNEANILLNKALYILVKWIEFEELDAEELIREKMAYNATRSYMHGKAF